MESMGVASGCDYWEVGVASRWNLWVCLKCIGVVILGGVVMKYKDFLIILLIPTPLVFALFLQQHPYFFVHFLNVFSFLFMLFLCNI